MPVMTDTAKPASDMPDDGAMHRFKAGESVIKLTETEPRRHRLPLLGPVHA